MLKIILSSLITSILLMLPMSVTLAQSKNFISIPAPAFTGENGSSGNDGYKGNLTGTARWFNVRMFAPVNLPHGATVTSLQCGGHAIFNRSIAFTLRRNEPQQANVDMATVRTSLAGTGFEFVSTNSITSGDINNSKFNYYIVAEIEDNRNLPNVAAICENEDIVDPLIPPHSKCSLNFCSIGYNYTSGGLNPNAGRPPDPPVN